MVVGFIYNLNYLCNRSYHHWCCGFDSCPGWGVQYYVIKFVSDLRKVCGFLWVLRFPVTYFTTIYGRSLNLGIIPFMVTELCPLIKKNNHFLFSFPYFSNRLEIFAQRFWLNCLVIFCHLHKKMWRAQDQNIFKSNNYIFQLLAFIKKNYNGHNYIHLSSHFFCFKTFVVTERKTTNLSFFFQLMKGQNFVEQLK
jgi:hypothetical protein